MKKNILFIMLLNVLSVSFSPLVNADDTLGAFTTAIFTFTEKTNRLKGYGEKVSNILFANLAVNKDINLVDREELNKVFAETELNLSGLVSPEQTVQIGQLTGAKILVTGTLFELDDTLIIVAKITGVETSRVIGVKVQGKINDSLLKLVESLSLKVASSIKENGNKLIIQRTAKIEQFSTLKRLKKSIKPVSVTIDIPEKHIGQNILDPAAETEMSIYFSEAGFKLIDRSSTKANRADIIIKGEGFSGFATRHGGLISVKARLEVKAIDRVSGEIIAIDRQVEVVVDINEQIAAKKALQNAAAKISERIIAKLVDRE